MNHLGMIIYFDYQFLGKSITMHRLGCKCEGFPNLIEIFIKENQETILEMFISLHIK
jgi:hypothetical protein